MPTVRVETNLSADFFPSNFLPMFLIALAEILGKDKNIMKYVFYPNVDMTIVSTCLVNDSYKLLKSSFRVQKMWIILMVTSFGQTSQPLQYSVTQTFVMKPCQRFLHTWQTIQIFKRETFTLLLMILNHTMLEGMVRLKNNSLLCTLLDYILNCRASNTSKIKTNRFFNNFIFLGLLVSWWHFRSFSTSIKLLHCKIWMVQEICVHWFQLIALLASK